MFSVFVTNLVTPRSTAPTSSFKVRIYDSLGNLQYKRESQAFSAVAQAQPFGKVVLLRSSQMNNALNTTYDFLLNISQPVYKNEFIKITPPSTVTIQAA